jgi:methionyl-tRNA formyltransferase
MHASESAVKRLASKLGLPIYQPESLKSEPALEPIASTRPEVLVVAAYGLILPPPMLALAPRGAINIHASLLPRWRGAAPIQRALLAGDLETGITIMQMDAGLDTGPMLAQHRLAIGPEDDAGSLHDKLAALGAGAIVRALAELEAGRVHAKPQPAEGVTYARKVSAAEAEVDWTQTGTEIERRLRALRPSPGARTRLRGETIKLWRASRASARGEPGVVLAADDAGVLVACGEGALRVSELQRAGGRRLAAAEFLRGCPIGAGERLGPAR